MWKVFESGVDSIFAFWMHKIVKIKILHISLPAFSRKQATSSKLARATKIKIGEGCSL